MSTNKKTGNNLNSMDPNIVYTTKDYDKFKYIPGNREVSVKAGDSLAASIAEVGLIEPITINEKWQIIDGQRRFKSCEKRGLEVRFILHKGANLKHVKLMNTLNKSWTFENYLNIYRQDVYADAKPHYDKIHNFRENHTTLNNNLILLLLHGGWEDAKTHSFFPLRKAFKEGEFKVNNLAEAEIMAPNLEKLVGSHKNARGQNVPCAALILSSQCKGFDWDHLATKMAKYGHRVPGQNGLTIIDLAKALCRIYNLNTKDRKKKITFYPKPEKVE